MRVSARVLLLVQAKGAAGAVPRISRALHSPLKRDEGKRDDTFALVGDRTHSSLITAVAELTLCVHPQL